MGVKDHATGDESGKRSDGGSLLGVHLSITISEEVNAGLRGNDFLRGSSGI